MTTPNPEIVASVLEALKQDRSKNRWILRVFIIFLFLIIMQPIGAYVNARYINEHLSSYTFRKVADKDLCIAALWKSEKRAAVGYLFNVSREDEYRELVNRGIGLSDCMKILNLKPIDTSAAESSSDDKEEAKGNE